MTAFTVPTIQDALDRGEFDMAPLGVLIKDRIMNGATYKERGSSLELRGVADATGNMRISCECGSLRPPRVLVDVRAVNDRAKTLYQRGAGDEHITKGQRFMCDGCWSRGVFLSGEPDFLYRSIKRQVDAMTTDAEKNEFIDNVFGRPGGRYVEGGLELVDLDDLRAILRDGPAELKDVVTDESLGERRGRAEMLRVSFYNAKDWGGLIIDKPDPVCWTKSHWFEMHGAPDDYCSRHRCKVTDFIP